MMTATVPIAPPSASEPTSPMKISAGCALYQRNPMLAPTMAPQKMVTSPTCGMRLQFKVVGKDGVSADVGEHGQRAGGDHGAANGETVKPIREVHRVAGPDDDENHKSDERQESQRPQMRDAASRLRDKVRPKILEERNDQMRGVIRRAASAIRPARCDYHASQDLQHQLAARRSGPGCDGGRLSGNRRRIRWRRTPGWKKSPAK